MQRKIKENTSITKKVSKTIGYVNNTWWWASNGL